MASTNDPLLALQPNYLGDQFANMGVDQISANYGLGLGALTNAEAGDGPKRTAGTNSVDRVRNAKARQFGKTKETVF